MRNEGVANPLGQGHGLPLDAFAVAPLRVLAHGLLAVPLGLAHRLADRGVGAAAMTQRTIFLKRSLWVVWTSALRSLVRALLRGGR